jgi:hypothetical protein
MQVRLRGWGRDHGWQSLMSRDLSEIKIAIDGEVEFYPENE